MWHEQTRQLQEQGKVQLVGIILEQHPDRCRLFMQWQEMDWPVMVDSLNLTKMTTVPFKVFIDESGVVQAIQPGLADVDDFVARDSPSLNSEQERAVHPDIDLLRQRTETQRRTTDLSHLGDSLFNWGTDEDLTEAIATYRAASRLAPDDSSLRFRLGVAHRRRFETPGRAEDDFSIAIAEWSAALKADPNQYIWRRRLQQYGPRLDKPYPFYDWVAEARAAITAHGDTPVELVVEPMGSELARPARGLQADLTPGVEPDPQGLVTRDPGLINVAATVVPHTSQRHNTSRVHLHFRPDETSGGHWNNESEPMQIWIDPPEGWEIDRRLQHIANPESAVSDELRTFEFEVRGDVKPEPGMTLSGYALYNVCEGDSGLCLFRRLDFLITLR